MPDRFMEPREQAQYEDEDLYASPRTASYKDGSAKFIRVAVFAVMAVAVGGAIAYGTMTAPKVADEEPAAQTEKMAFNQAAPTLPPAPLPDAVPAPEAKPVPAPKPAPKAAPVPAPLADEQNQPVDVDPTTPEVLSPIPEVPVQ